MPNTRAKNKIDGDSMDIGCAEFAVPGDTLEEKLRTLESHGMWLELVNDGKRQVEDILGAQSSFSVPIKSVQAYLQHEMNMLSADTQESEAAVSYVEETIRAASALGAQNVVVIITYGEPKIEEPKKKSVELFKRFGKLAEDVGVTVSAEPLGQSKTTFIPSATDVLQLVREVNSSRVQLMIDTMHVHSTGQNPSEVIKESTSEISEIQLRDTNSKPPGRGTIDFTSIMNVIHRKFEGLLCLEYHPSSDPRKDLESALKTVT